MNRTRQLQRAAVAGATALLAAVVCAGAAALYAQADIATEFKYGIDRHRGDGRRAVLGVSRASRSLSRQAAQPSRHRLRAAGFHLRNAGERSADRDDEEHGLDSARRAQLRDVPRRRLPGRSRRAPKIVLGMPAHQMDLQGYARFLSACAKDPRFNADTLVAAMQKHPEFGFLDGLTYKMARHQPHEGRHPRTGQANRLVRQAAAPGTGARRHVQPVQVDVCRAKRTSTPTTPWAPPICRRSGISGCGRDCGCTGTATTTPWMSATRAPRSAPARRPDSLDLAALDRIAQWILDLKPPPFPPERIDTALATAGRPIYQQHCASCHDIGQPRVGQVTDIAEIGTDPERLRSFTAGAGRPR